MPAYLPARCTHAAAGALDAAAPPARPTRFMASFRGGCGAARASPTAAASSCLPGPAQPSPAALLCPAPEPENSPFAIPFGVRQAVAQVQWAARDFSRFFFFFFVSLTQIQENTLKCA